MLGVSETKARRNGEQAIGDVRHVSLGVQTAEREQVWQYSCPKGWTGA